MSNEKLLERKTKLEQEMFQVVEQRNQLMETMKLAQKSLSQLRDQDLSMDGRYKELCEVLSLDPQEEFSKFIASKQVVKDDAKEIPTEGKEPSKK